MNKIIKLLVTIGLEGAGLLNADAQQFDQLTRPVAILSDSIQVWEMLDALLIPALGTVDRADVVDVTANGFGPNDLVILYPTMETYEIGMDVPHALQESMKSWEISADYRLDALRPERRRIALDAHANQDARAALTTDVLGVISQYYLGDDFDMRMSQDSEGVRLEIWNYDPNALRYRGPVQPVIQDTLWQRFNFATPTVVMSFKDVSDCVETHADEGYVQTRSCK